MSAPLPAPSPRRLIHSRSIQLQGYERDDGLFEVEGELLDTKTFAFNVGGSSRAAGQPIHRMALRMTFDRTLTIVAAAASSTEMPYLGQCDQITAQYEKLVGVQIRAGFSHQVKTLFGGVRGCTHITELIGAVATTAFQTLSGRGVADPEQKPFQLDGCHALKSDQPVVAQFYPRWYTGELPVDLNRTSEE